jgi:hypothetical protein
MAKGRVAAIIVAAGSVAGTVLMRRRRRQQQSRADLYFEDGSMVSLAPDAAEADAMMRAAGVVLAG